MIYIASFTISKLLYMNNTSLVAQMVKNLPAMWKTQVWSLGWEDPLEKGMATYSSILAWKIPWTEEPDGLYSPWGCRVRHDSNWACMHGCPGSFHKGGAFEVELKVWAAGPCIQSPSLARSIEKGQGQLPQRPLKQWLWAFSEAREFTGTHSESFS